MSRQKNSILVNEHALNCEPVPLTSSKSESLVDDDLFFFLFFISIDTFSSKPYWFNNYTEIYVRLVAKNYSDVVIGM